MSPTRIKFLAFRVYRFRDRQAYDDLYAYFGPKLYRFLAFKLPRSEDADELTGEVFLRAWEYMVASDVQEVGGLYFKIARNLIADFYRKHQVTSELMDTSPAAIQPGSLTEDIANKLEIEQLRSRIKQLSPEQAEVITLRFFDDMSVEEIAAVTQKTPNNVRVLIHRARQALHKYEKSQSQNESPEARA